MCATAKPLPAGIEPISGEEARHLIRHTGEPELTALMARASKVREAVHGNAISLCAIANARSGGCGEDCAFCSQSARFQGTGAPVYPMMAPREIADQARAAEAAGAREFSVVTSGTRLGREADLAKLEEALRLVAGESSVMRCASLGLMRKPELARLQRAGLQSFHHNLETARSHFDRVCTTHTFDEQLETLRAAKALGLRVCSGGILGMGETPEQRVELAETLRDLAPDCVPLNFLNPRPGTPLAGTRAITAEACLAAIAVFRLMMPGTHLFAMGGREVNLGDRQHLVFAAGADGTMVGNYLTSAGTSPGEVVRMIRAQGLAVRPTGDPERWAFQGEAPEGEAAWNRRAAERDRQTAERERQSPTPPSPA